MSVRWKVWIGGDSEEFLFGLRPYGPRNCQKILQPRRNRMSILYITQWVIKSARLLRRNSLSSVLTTQEDLIVMNMHPKTWLFVALLSLSSSAFAVPLTLEGMGLVSTWRDVENVINDILSDPWGNSDDLFADRVGIYVEFADGTKGSATYSGIVAADWNQCCADITRPDTITGAFTNAMLHGLNHTLLPMAWHELAFNSPYSNNFDLDYTNDQFGSNFRANTGGWRYVDIALYSSVAPVQNVPEPVSLGLVALGLVGAWRQRRTSKS
ncbi:MAG: PEP-CTERM sorting domain-containing protein [Gammaproteobacteria bacterium]